MGTCISLPAVVSRFILSFVGGIVLLLTAIPFTARAGEFTTKNVGDYGNVTVMEVAGNYDANNQDGTVNAIPRQAIAKEFFKTHKDEYDFLVIFSNFNFKMPEEEAVGFYHGVKNDVRGIGRELFDNTSLYGSSGKLQGTIDMGNLADKVSDPLDPRFEDTLGVLSHEMLHRWSAFAKFRDAFGNTSTALLGKDGAHWSFLLDTKGSLQYGNQWRDNGNGTFTSIAIRKYFSPLDLYLMGMIDKSKVLPMLLIENPAIDPKKMPELGSTITGTARTVTIEDIIAIEGERLPSAKDSQKQFKIAFIFVTTPGSFTGNELPGIENIRNGFLTRYSILTDGKGLVEVASILKDDVPVNPGTKPVTVVPRTLPPDIEEGVAWLKNHQQPDGSWTDLSLTVERDTAEAVSTLQIFPTAGTQYQLGLQWLGNTTSANTDYLARRLITVADTGGETAAYVRELAALQNPDGGWGSARSFISSPTDTALTLKALLRSGYGDREAIGKAVEFLKSRQNNDGGWSDGGSFSAVQPTAAAVSVFTSLKKDFILTDQLDKGVAWLLGRQNPDGGFGNSPSTVYDSSLAVMSLREAGADLTVTDRGVNYIQSQQSENGSWLDSPFQTAVAVKAVWQATVNPDLSIKNTDISFIPEKITSLPTTAVINAVISNLGRTDVPLAKVALYDGMVSPDRKVGEQVVAFPALSQVTVTFSVPVNDGNSHTFHLVVDPDNQVKESNKNNNSAVKALLPEVSYDFQVLPGDVSISKNPADIYQDVKVSAKVTNRGTSDAYNVQLRFFINEAGSPFEIATITTDIPAGATVTREITWKANKVGTNMPLTVQADPFNSFTEITETNNQASIPITVNGSTLANLAVSYKDILITPNPVKEQGTATISIEVKNAGYAAAENIKVNFYKGVPGNNGELIGTGTVPVLAPGQRERVTINWGPIADSGERIIYVVVDPDNAVQEIAKDDNEAFTTLTILSLPDLAISSNSIVLEPNAPKEGDSLALKVTVQNGGSQDALNVAVQVKENGVVIGGQIIPLVAGNASASVLIPYPTGGKTGTHEVQATVDPDNIIAERTKDNNKAVKTFSIQNANLWVSEPYFSPNGDGVKDTTDFFFRLAAPAKVKVLVVTSKGETVRTFSGGELDNTSGATVTWDGLGDSGTVVADGEYQMQVADGSGSVLGSLPVVVDTNRSPLTDAIGTKYLLHTNLTCPFTYYTVKQWLPDESGVLVFVEGDPVYESGLYKVSPDGYDIQRIFPYLWSEGNFEYLINHKWHLSPDGRSIAYLLRTRDKTAGKDALSVWTVDINGENLKLLKSIEDPEMSEPGEVSWSPDGNGIAYVVGNYSKRKFLLLYSKADGSGDTILATEEGVNDLANIAWSKDSSKIAYTTSINYLNDTSLKVTNMEGDKKNLASFPNAYPYSASIHWLDNNNIILWNNKRNLYRVEAHAENIYSLLSDNVINIIKNRTGNKLAYYTTTSDNYYSDVKVYVYDGKTTYKLHSASQPIGTEISVIEDINWSSDGLKLSFVDRRYEQRTDNPNIYNEYVVSVNIESWDKNAVQISDTEIDAFPELNSYNVNAVIPSQRIAYLRGLHWLDDNANLVAQDIRGILVINSVGGLKSYLPIKGKLSDYDTFPDVSPMGRYINYFKSVDSSSPCYNEKHWKEDLWTLGSALNLIADLRVNKNESSIFLKGIASDKNFAGYKLEYADQKDPNSWNLVMPPSEAPIVNDVFTTWVPPHEGTFYVKLTVWDHAGNTATSKKRVSWGLSSSITNLYKSLEIFSPNGDGKKDTVELHYQVLEPVHLEFSVLDEKGHLVRTFRKDHLGPVKDSISWDGKDASGMVVADGKYTIKVFDYEFFVELDKTTPDVAISLGKIDDVSYQAQLIGHALDKNLKQWTVLHGEGENPQEWDNSKSGSTPLFALDEKGEVVNQSIGLYGIKFLDFGGGFKIAANYLEWLVNKTFRIDGADFAENRRSFISGRLEEKISLVLWDGNMIPRMPDMSAYIPAMLMRPAMYHLEVLETVRNPLSTFKLQYAVYDVNAKEEVWQDDPTHTVSASGIVTLEWDRAKIGTDIRAVRFKGVDTSGKEFYSQRYSVEENFSVSCDGSVVNTLFNKLKILKFQLKSPDDTRYKDWTDVQVFDTTKGETIPEGTFHFPYSGDQIIAGKQYSIRMIGVNRNDSPINSNSEKLGCDSSLSVRLAVNYPEGECGDTQKKAVFSVQNGMGFPLHKIEIPGFPKSLEYYMDRQEGPQLLRRFDLSKEEIQGISIDTTSMAEGKYGVKAVVHYVGYHDGSEKKAEAVNALLVDRVLPVARFSYPAGSSLMLCPVQMNEMEGPWFAISPEGVAEDQNGVKKYELLYGIGEDPTFWTVATTKKVGGSGNLVSIDVTGSGSLKGTIGKWDITGLNEKEKYVLKLKVSDEAGNVSCGTSAPFSFNNALEIPSLTLDKKLFSPNGDGVFDNVNASYQIDEYAQVDVKTFRLIESTNAPPILDATPVRTITAGQTHLNGTENVSWEGRNDAGAVVQDGPYGIAVFATDSCGNTNRKWTPVEVDNTPPTVGISYPRPIDPLPPGNIIEVRGSADDMHFRSYALEAGEGETPDNWTLIASGRFPVERTPANNILGRWNTFGKEGKWTIRLTAQDAAGNSNSTTSTVDLGERKTLIKDLTVVPLLFSPNNDNKLDTTIITYEVTDACQIKIEALGNADAVIREFLSTTQSSGTYNTTWDGKNTSGNFVPDGTYKIKLTASLVSNPSVSQSETITLVVDTTPPKTEITLPGDNAFINTSEIAVEGTINDPNISEYSMILSGPDGSSTLDSGAESRDMYNFGGITDLREDRYTITVHAKDQAENSAKLTRAFTIDRTPPKVTLDTPKSGEYYGNTNNVIDITGAIVEKNLARYSLRFGRGEASTELKEVVGGDTIPAKANLYSWKVGKDDEVPDGVYTVSLYAEDQAGLEGEAKAKITIDNTAPDVSITSPIDGGYIKGPFAVKGTLADANLDKGIVELSEGKCTSASKWVTVKNLTASVNNGTVVSLAEVPADGNYCLRLSAVDKTGKTSEAKISIIIDTTPPAEPVLSGRIENKTDIKLDWTKNNESDLAGYNLYRDNVKLNTALLKDITYQESNLKEGTYTYSVKAIDFAGNESELSNSVKMTIDVTPPNVRIASPADSSLVSNMVDIRGTAFSADDFKHYRISIGLGASPESWKVIRTSPVPISYGSLAEWDTISLAEGSTYTIKLEGEDITGNISTQKITVTVDNTPPAKPLLLAATPTDADVALAWGANSEPDLAGYLLYRNHQLANVSGIVVGNLKPYLLTRLSHGDNALPDGKHTYYLIAMDQAGNTSDQSNSIDVEIDTHRPHMVIVEPADGAKLDSKTLIKAESPDIDIVSVQLQYKKTQDSAWTNLGAPVTKAPYITYMDPESLGLVHGDYQIMAIATDKVGLDPAPTPITVTYTDLTPPVPLSSLQARTSGKDVILSWTANGETDLDGYNIYRTLGSDRTKVNTSPVKGLTYTDTGLPDGDYIFEVTASDTYGNESKSSNTASARVYAPVISQPYTPTGVNVLKIEGNGAGANTSVEVFVENNSGRTSAGIVAADGQGAYVLENVNLTLGENRITATATNGGGNVSRESEAVVVVCNDTPSAPANLAADVLGHTVDLSWDAQNTDPEVIGYNIFRDGSKLNQPIPVTVGNATASSSDTNYSSRPYYPYYPSYALDGKASTEWRSGWQSDSDYWWQVDLAKQELINRLEIHWGSSGEVIFGGKDFEIQAWSGYAWIPVAKVSGNDKKDNIIDLKPSYLTNKIRIRISNDMSGSIRIAEVNILKDNLVPVNSYRNTDLADKKYTYQVTAVDKYGFESLPSEEKTVDVGDVIPPAAPLNLNATAINTNVTLDWSLTPNTETDLAGYNVYRKINGVWSQLNGTILNETSYVDAGLPNDVYTYRITATDNVGNESSPSNEAAATVANVLPAAPEITVIQGLPQGEISIQWTCAAINVSGYTVYRGTASGGPYTRLNTQLLAKASYVDTGLVNGGTYFYVVTATDAIGNTSRNSNEVSAVSLDTATPGKPAIVRPTLPGIPVSIATGKTDVSGTADLATTVELFRNGVSVGNTAVVDQQQTESVPLSSTAFEASLSPDGTRFLYSNNDSIRLVDMASGQDTEIVSSALYPSWLDEHRFSYNALDPDQNTGRIGIYDINTGTTSYVTDDASADEWLPSWSADRNKVAFFSDRDGDYAVWIKDVSSGVLTRVLDDVFFSLSPGGDKLAYVVDQVLFVLDLSTGSTTQVSDSIAEDGLYLIWSPDRKNLAYVARSGQGYEVYTFDTATGVSAQVTNTQHFKLVPVWSPDGSRIAYAEEDISGDFSIWITDLNGTLKLLEESISYVRDIEWEQPGSLVYTDGGFLDSIAVQAQFRFTDVELNPGENKFYVTSTDSAGNASPPSDEIAVSYDSKLPDLSVSTEDIVIYPTNPKPGQDVVVQSAIKNIGRTKAENFTVELHLWDSAGNLSLFKSEIIPSLAAGAETTVSTRLPAGTQPGSNTVIVAVDPSDDIKELLEANNYATGEFFIAEKEELIMTTTVAAAQYSSAQDVPIMVDLRNTGTPVQAKLEVVVEDEAGVKVAPVESLDLTLTYGPKKTLSYKWNTGSTFAGNYQIHSTLKGAAGIMAENRVPFAITPDVKIDTKILTDKTAYDPNENVNLTVSARNAGINYIIPKLSARIRITDASARVMFADNREIINLFPAAESAVKPIWNTGLAEPGTYTATVDIFLADTLVVSKNTTFSVKAVPVVTGSIIAEPAVVSIGDSFKAIFSVANSGNSEANGTLRGMLVEPESQTVLSSSEQPANIPANSSTSGEFTFASEGLSLKTYVARLQYVSGDTVKTLADASVTVKDGKPPVVTILSPSEGKTYFESVGILALVHDDSSGVQKAEYAIDNGEWKLLPVSDPSQGRYSTTWKPKATDSGSHTFSCRAWDTAGNMSEPVSTSFIVQLDTTPPILTVSTLGDGAVTNQEILNVAGTVTDNIGVRELLINGEYVPVNADGSFSHAVVLTDGDNRITTTAFDQAGNRADDARTIILDRHAPVLEITSPADNLRTGVQSVELAGTVNKPCSVEIKLNGVTQHILSTDNGFAATLVPAPGLNDILVTATDAAGNTSSQKRTVFYDNQKPTLSITNPAKDIKTNVSSMIIKGLVSDAQGAVSLTLDFDGTKFTPSVVDGAFQQPVTFTEEKPYTIIATASDGIAGHEVSAQRNVIYDVTKPVLTIDPVSSPTEQTDQVVTGTREAGTLVTVTCPTATVGEVNYPTTTTWSVALSNLKVGENVVTASAADEAGNQATVSATIVVQTNGQDIVLIPFPDILWPPNHKMVPVFIAGWVKNPCQSGIKSVNISVTDEYGKYNYKNLHFGSIVMLEAWRKGNDMDGRTYTVTAVATYKDGRKTKTTEKVVVPHDMSHHGGGGCGFGY